MPKFKPGHKVNATHGMSRMQIYQTWARMFERCRNKNHHAYSDYGGRGITVCESWHKFENFLADMGERPKGRSLDRIDNSLGYSPENCRWATPEEQQNNTRAAHMLEFNGERLSISQWSRKLGVSRNRIRTRLQTGMSVAEALTTPKLNSWSRDLKGRRDLTFKGVTKNVSDWSQTHNIPVKEIFRRLRRGWSLERALTKPLRSNPAGNM